MAQLELLPLAALGLVSGSLGVMLLVQPRVLQITAAVKVQAAARVTSQLVVMAAPAVPVGLITIQLVAPAVTLFGVAPQAGPVAVRVTRCMGLGVPVV